MKTKLSSVFILLMTAAIWGFAFVAQVVGGESLGPFWFNAIRFFIGGVVLLPVVFFAEHVKNEKGRHVTLLAGIVAGVILCAASNLQNTGINITGSSGRAGFITALYTVLVPLFGALFLKKHTNRHMWIGAVMALVGLFLILSGGMTSSDTPLVTLALDMTFRAGKPLHGTLSVGLGDVVLLLCAVGYTAHILFLDTFSAAVYPIRFSCIQFFTACLLSLVLAVIKEPFSTAAVSNAMLPLLYTGILSTGVAFTTQLIGQKGAEPTVAAIVMSTESIFAALGGALLLHERLSAAAYIGCAVIFAGIVLAQIPVKKNTDR